MNDETAQLQRDIDAEKAALAENISALEDKARGITDWRAQVGKHPFAALGVALAAGAAVAIFSPRRRLVVVHRTESGGDGEVVATSGESLLSNPVVERVVGALVAVAAAKAVDAISGMIPGLGHHVPKAAPAPEHTNGAATTDFKDRRTNPPAQPS